MKKVALMCIRQGWYVFPLQAGTKDRPCIKNWQELCSNDPKQIEAWWSKWPESNVAVVCGRSGLLVVDIDVKGNYNGFDSLKELQDKHQPLSTTFMVSTPTGGRHYYFKGKGKNTAGFLGGGIDTRGTRGYVLAPNSKVKFGRYKAMTKVSTLQNLPPWLSKLLQKHRTKTSVIPDVGLDSKQAINRTIEYLTEKAEPAIEGSGGDNQTFIVGCGVRDYGISEAKAFQLMLEHYNPRCQPPWTPQDLEKKVTNVYNHAANPVAGLSNPVADFDDDPPTEIQGVPITEENIEKKRAEGKKKAKKAKAGSIKEEEANSKPDYAGGRFKDWVYIAKSKIFFNRANNAELGHQSFEMLWSHIIEGPKTKIVDKISKSSTLMPKFYNFCYHPKRGRSVIEDGTLLFNLWKDTRMKAVEGDTEWFTDHLLYLCRGRTEIVEHVLDWLAWAVQYPEKKLSYSLLIQSVPGCGKSIIGFMMKAIIGHYNCSEPKDSDLESQFNTWIKGKQLCVIQELMVDGKLALANKLKPLITEETVSINEKNRPAYTLSNYMNFLFFTNYVDAAKIEKGDRRYLVILGPNEKQTKAYYNALWINARDRTKQAAICHLLMTRDLSHFDGQTEAPYTEDKTEMRQAGMSEVHLFLYELLEEGQFPFNCPLISKERMKAVVPPQFSKYAQKEANKFMREELQCIKLGQVYLPKAKERRSLWVWGPDTEKILKLTAVEQGALYEEAENNKKVSKAQASHLKVVGDKEVFADDDELIDL